jgi:hypothetical protein
VKQQTGTNMWMIKVEDIAGKVYEMKNIFNIGKTEL